jgi:uncharacterized damage-inducible protein DinB
MHMNKEILAIANQLKDAYEGDPWWGRNAGALLGEVDERIAVEKPSGQHSILELVWHMINWKEFVISRLHEIDGKDLHYFETNDWRHLDHAHKSLWHQGVERLRYLHNELINLLEQQGDDLLDQPVAERDYTYRKLFNGILQHDIYHLGQIAYIVKVVRK